MTQQHVPKPIKIERKVLEKHVEKFLVTEISKLGGACYKWSSANVRGVPDRICIFPNGDVHFVELKRDRTCKLSGPQKSFFNNMAKLKVDNVHVLYGKEDVVTFIDHYGCNT